MNSRESFAVYGSIIQLLRVMNGLMRLEGGGTDYFSNQLIAINAIKSLILLEPEFTVTEKFEYDLPHIAKAWKYREQLLNSAKIST